MSRPTNVPVDSQTNRSVEAIQRSRDRVWEYRLLWLLLLSMAGLWGSFYFLDSVDGKLTAAILKQLRKELPNHLVYLDRVHFRAGESITIEGIRIAKPTNLGPRDILRCSRVVCSGPIDMLGLAQGQLPVQSVVADGVEVCVWPMSDGRFSIQDLSSGKPVPENFPTIEIRSGLVRIGNESGRTEQEIICHDLRGRAGLTQRVRDGQIMPIAVTIDASVASSYFNHAEVHGTISQDKKSFVAQGTLTKLAYSPRLASQLPAMCQPYLNHAAGFSGELNAVFSLRNDRGALNYKAHANIVNGRLLHPQVPYPLESLYGEVFIEDGMLQSRNVRATSGQTQVALAFNMRGLKFGSPFTSVLSVRDLALDDRLFHAIPASMQETWRKLGMSGVVDAQAQVVFDGENWTPQVKVQAKNVGLEPEFFPYPIRKLCGEFICTKNSIVASALQAEAGEQVLRGALSMNRAQPRWLMDLSIAANGPIAIDETLLRALSPRGGPQSNMHKFALSLHPTGTMHLKQGRFVRSEDNPEVVSRSLELTFSECSIKYDGFKYPIVDVHGEATIDNNRILLRDFVGRNDGARIKGYGLCQCYESGLESLELLFDAYDVGLDEELQMAMPTGVRGLWDQLQPKGVIDNIAVTIQRAHRDDNIDMRVEITEDRAAESHAGNAVSVRPVSLPYQINDVACKIVYRPGRIDINALSGWHESSRLQAEGQCRLHADGTWDGMLTWLPTTRLIVDQSLLTCLPTYLKDSLLRLDFRGPVSITGKTRVSSSPTPTESIVRDWDLELQVEDGRLGGGGIASGIRGSIELSGENTPMGPMAIGRLALDALAIKGIAVTDVSGPFAFSNNDLLLGRDVVAWQAKSGWRPPNLYRESNDSSVATAHYVAPASGRSQVSGIYGNGSHVEQASYRGPLRENIHQRFDQLQKRVNPEPATNPNEVRPPSQIPSMDIVEDDIRARTLSGTMFFSGTEPLDGLQRAKYRLRLVDADFQGFLLDLGETNTVAGGRLYIQTDLQGVLTNIDTLEGQGRAWLREANLYELPTMISIFRFLSVSPNQGAFDSADLQFGIDGDRLPVNELVLDGDIVSMRGSGWVNMRRELHLDMFANVGSKSLVGALFHPIARTNAAKLWQFEINGTTTDPQIRRPMPLMNSFDRVLPENPILPSNR